MNPLVIGLPLAFLASLALNGSYLMQHAGAAHTVAVNMRHPIRTMRGLLSARLWLYGALLGTVGWAMHIAALTKAPLSLVQAFLVGGLAPTAVLAARFLHHSLSRKELIAIAMMVMALVGLCVGTGHVDETPSYSSTKLAIYLTASLALGGVLACVHAGRRAQALGAAGGVLYGASDVAIKALTVVGAQDGVLHILYSPWLAGALITNVSAFFCFQRGLQTGSAVPVITLMTAGTNVVSVVGGFVIFGDPLGATTAFAILHGVCFVAVGVAAWMLAPAQAAVTAGAENVEPEAEATEATRPPATVAP